MFKPLFTEKEQLSLSWMAKQNMVFSTMEYSSAIQSKSNDIHYNIDQPWKHYAK